MNGVGLIGLVVVVLLISMTPVMIGSASAAITVTSPAAGDNVSGIWTITWEDSEGYAGPYDLKYYDPYNGTYVLIVSNLTNTRSFDWNTIGLNSSVSPTGAIYMYRVQVINTTPTVDSGVSDYFVIDNIAPSLSVIVSPTNDTVLNGTVTVLVDVADNLFLRNVTLTNDTAEVVDVNTTIEGTLSNEKEVRVILTYNTSAILDGFDNLTATVYDMANNSLDSVTVRVIIDHTPPTVTIIKPTANEWFNANFTVEANITDANGVKEVYCRLENDSWASDLIPMTLDPTTGNYTAVIDITNVADGSYRVRINTSDIAQPDANWNNETNVSIGIDKTPPVLTNAFVRYPASQNAARNGDIIEINVTVDGALAGVDSVRANVSQINSTVGWLDLTRVGGTNYYNATVVVNTTDGVYSIPIIASDNAGNENSTTVTVIVDNTPPLITILTPTTQNPIYINNGTVYWVNFTYVEENPMNYTVKVWNENRVINETPPTDLTRTSPTQINVSFTVYALDGKYNVTVTMYDNATNSNSTAEVYAVVVDNTLPTAPVNLTATADKGAIILKWEAASDALSGVAYYKIYRSTQSGVGPNNYDDVYITTETSYLDFNGTPGETYYYVVTAVDRAGNEGPASNEANTTFIKGEPEKILFIDAPSQMIVGSNETILVKVLDKYNRPVPAERVSFGTTAGIVTPAINTTNESGVAIATLYAPIKVGTAIITVYVNYPNVNNSTTVEFVPAEYADARVYADPEEIPADGNSTTTITVELLDEYGNLNTTSGVYVYLTTTAGWFIAEDGEKVKEIYGFTDNGTFNATLVSTTEPTTAIITANVAGVGEINTTVVFLAPAKIKYSDLVVKPTEGVAPLTVNVSANVTNIGEVEGTYNATLVINGVIVDYKTGTLKAGESTTVTFQYTFEKPGTYSVTVDGLEPPRQVTVRAPANITVVGLEVTPEAIPIGQYITIKVTVHNYGDVAGSYVANVIITKPDGSIDYVEISFLEVVAGETVTQTAQYEPDIIGNYIAEIDGLKDTFTVLPILTVQLVKGWQMISVPLEPPIACDEMLIAFTWDAVNKTYEEVEEFEPGKGYWVLSTKDMVVTFTGSAPLCECEVNLTKGWNLIGSIAYEVHLPTIVEENNLPIMKVAYTWDPVEKKYVPTEILEPGKAYWILAFNNTTLTLTVTPPLPPPS